MVHSGAAADAGESSELIDRLMCFGVDLPLVLSLALIARHYRRTVCRRSPSRRCR